MTTLIVGPGFVGLRVAARLRERGERVLGTTRDAGRAARLRDLGIEPVVLDVLGRQPTELPAFDCLVYCVGFDRGAAVPMRAVYVEGLARFLGWVEGREFRFVYASSTGVYGQDDASIVTEDDTAEPRHEAGRVCLEAEGIASSRGAIILRLAGLYGPGRIIRRSALLAGEPVIGDPEKRVNLVHGDDAASAVVAGFELGRPSRIYNVADDRPLSRRELYTLTASHLGAPQPTFLLAGAGQAREEADRRIDNGRTKQELGLVLRYPDAAAGIPASIAEERVGS